uniref:Ion transport domain-containing protein n=1 Tax=Magallana gigas TaxID=29159 RepID=A0A8W8NWB7_MAGGI
MLHVAQQFTPAFMHHCLGACERVHATLAKRLTPYKTNDKSNWEDCLSPIVFSINCPVNTSLGYSPYEIVFLRRPTFPLVKGCMKDQSRSHRSYYRRMKRYLNDFWNVVDLLSYVSLIAALCICHFHLSQTFTYARRMFSLSLLVMYLKFLEVFFIHGKLGPTPLMIKEILKDLLGFLSVAVFVVLGVGIYYHANLWPDHQTILKGDWTNWRIWTIIYYPFGNSTES